MNILSIASSFYSTYLSSAKSVQGPLQSSNTNNSNVNSTAKMPDTMASATKSGGGDHYFEAKV
jgi:hypothetical protein